MHAGPASQRPGGSEALDNRCRFLCFVQNNLDDQLIKMYQILESLEKRNKALYYTGSCIFGVDYNFAKAFLRLSFTSAIALRAAGVFASAFSIAKSCMAPRYRTTVTVTPALISL